MIVKKTVILKDIGLQYLENIIERISGKVYKDSKAYIVKHWAIPRGTPCLIHLF